MPTPSNLLLLASAARTAAQNTDDQYNYAGHRGLELIIDITAITATPAVTFTIQGKDPISGKYYTILASTALGSVATTVLRVYPGLTAAANSVANANLPLVWRVSITVGDADSATYSLAANLLP